MSRIDPFFTLIGALVLLLVGMLAFVGWWDSVVTGDFRAACAPQGVIRVYDSVLLCIGPDGAVLGVLDR